MALSASLLANKFRQNNNVRIELAVDAEQHLQLGSHHRAAAVQPPSSSHHYAVLQTDVVRVTDDKAFFSIKSEHSGFLGLKHPQKGVRFSSLKKHGGDSVPPAAFEWALEDAEAPLVGSEPVVRSNALLGHLLHVSSGLYLTHADGKAVLTADKASRSLWRVCFDRVTIAILGGGNRGGVYQRYGLERGDICKVVGIADAMEYRRKNIAAAHHIDDAHVFQDFHALTQVPRFADAAVIALPDIQHREAAIACADLGYHLLLEKPMATTKEDCRAIVAAVERNHLILAVSHVMRYTPYSRKLKELVSSGLIGDIVNIQHLEPIGYFHFAHSYVRGNWRREELSSFSLLAKSCHDIDWIHWIMGRHCIKTQSFGGLYHFRRENKPAGAGSRCLECAVESECAYSAKKIYLDSARAGNTGWPVSIIVPGPVTEEGVIAALTDGPYGRCVYECDNDVNDNQVVNMLFDNGATASFSMVAFTKEICVRKTRIFGTRGELEGDGEHLIRHFDFLTNVTTNITPDATAHGTSTLTGHGYGDFYLTRDFIDAVLADDQSKILSGPRETLASHEIVFAAEESRHGNNVSSLEW